MSIPSLEDLYQKSVAKEEKVKQQFDVLRKKLPVMKQYFLHRTTSKEHVDWLTEVSAVLQESFNLDSLESVETEVKALSAVNVALLQSKESVEQAIANAHILELATSPAHDEEKPNVLEELWNSVQETASRKMKELEETLNLWTSYEKDCEQVLTCLTKGEMILTQVKSAQENKKEVLDELLDKVEVRD